MGLVYAEIELINGDDLALERRRLIDRDAIKRITVPALVDTGAIMLCINENIQEQLQLPIVETRKAQMANGHIIEFNVVANVELRFKNRETTCRALVLPGDAEPVFGKVALRGLYSKCFQFPTAHAK